MERLTADQVRVLLLDQMEDVEMPRRAADWCAEHEGKQINKARLPEAFELYRGDGGRPRLQWWDEKRQWHALDIVPWSADAPFVWPSRDWFEHANGGYLEWAEKRNADRRAILDEPGGCERVAGMFNAVVEAAAAYESARQAAFDALGNAQGAGYHFEKQIMGGYLRLQS